jgi:hypothetical protein
MSARTEHVTLELPVRPKRYAPGDPRNVRRWHAWVDAVAALALWFKSDSPAARPRPSRSRRRGA